MDKLGNISNEGNESKADALNLFSIDQWKKCN